MIILSFLVGEASLGVGQEIEGGRPQIRFVEGVERFDEGSEETGSASLEVLWQIDFTTGSIESKIGDEAFPSKHLLISNRSFAWVSPRAMSRRPSP